MNDKTYTASEALAIVAKDETKVARPRECLLGNTFLCIHPEAHYVLNSDSLTMLYVPADGSKPFIHPSTNNFMPRYFLPSIEWEVLDKSAVLSRTEVVKESGE